MKILLVGASGFIGSSVKKLLDISAHKVTSTSRSVRPGFVKFDAKDKDKSLSILKEISPDVVVNFAWNTIGEGYLDSSQNLNSLEWNSSLFNIISECSIRKFISLGSAAEYAPRPVLTGQNQLSPIGDSPYASTKIEALRLFLEIDKSAVPYLIWARVFQAYGPGQSHQRLIPTILNHVKNQQVFRLNYPNLNLDWIHVMDIASSIVYLIEKDSPTQVDIGTGSPTSNQELCSLFSKHFGLKYEFATSCNLQTSYRVAEPNSFLAQKCPPKFDLESYICSLRK